MILELPEFQYGRVRPLISGRTDMHVHMLGVVDANNRGKVFVDRRDHPRAALIWAMGCAFFLVGDPGCRDFMRSLNGFIDCELGPDSLESCGGTHFAVTLQQPGWLPALEELFRSREMERWNVLAFALDGERYRGFTGPALPSGVAVRSIDRSVIAGDAGRHLEPDILGDFWISTDRFLERGFGTCVMDGGEVVSACFTGYVSGTCHDMVIRTYDPRNRGKGYATLAARAYLDQCLARGLTPHWRTDEDNHASAAVARKCGFELYRKFPVLCFPFV